MWNTPFYIFGIYFYLTSISSETIVYNNTPATRYKEDVSEIPGLIISVNTRIPKGDSRIEYFQQKVYFATGLFSVANTFRTPYKCDKQY